MHHGPHPGPCARLRLKAKNGLATHGRGSRRDARLLRLRERRLGERPAFTTHGAQLPNGMDNTLAPTQTPRSVTKKPKHMGHWSQGAWKCSMRTLCMMVAAAPWRGRAFGPRCATPTFAQGGVNHLPHSTLIPPYFHLTPPSLLIPLMPSLDHARHAAGLPHAPGAPAAPRATPWAPAPPWRGRPSDTGPQGKGGQVRGKFCRRRWGRLRAR